MFGKKKKEKETIIDQALIDSISSYVEDALHPKPVEVEENSHSRDIRYSLRSPEGVYSDLICIAELGGREPTFTEELLYLMKQRNYSSSACYKKAHIDRKLFSQIMKNREYRPKKATVLAFILALELNMREANNLLCTAGYALSKADMNDLIIRYCIQNRIYDLDDVNEILYRFEQPVLGSK